MSIEIVIGDALKTEAKYICHQVNLYGVMGAGIAKQIKNLYPENYYGYKKLCNVSNSTELLGTTYMFKENGKTIINMFSQNGMGRNGCYTDYESFKSCLNHIKSFVPSGESVAMPYLIGCGIAGGDWKIVYDLINEVLGESHVVILYDIDGLSKQECGIDV